MEGHPFERRETLSDLVRGLGGTRARGSLLRARGIWHESGSPLQGGFLAFERRWQQAMGHPKRWEYAPAFAASVLVLHGLENIEHVKIMAVGRPR